MSEHGTGGVGDSNLCMGAFFLSGLDSNFQILDVVQSVKNTDDVDTVDTAKDAMAEQAKAVFELAGFKVDFSGGYPGWAPDASSPILHTMKEVYKGLYSKEPAVMAIHAGLECGILGGAYPHWDMVSCGPTILSPHSPDERVNVESVGKWWKFVTATLENIPEK